MKQQKTQSQMINDEKMPKHFKLWLGNQMTIIEKPHQINERRSRFEIAKNFTVVRKY